MLDLMQEIQSVFKESANPEKQVQMENYMKNKFSYFGIASPIRKEISKSWLNIL